MWDKELIEEANRALYELVGYVPRLLEALYYSNQRENNYAGSMEACASRDLESKRIIEELQKEMRFYKDNFYNSKDLSEDAKLRELAEKMAGEKDA